MEEPDEVYSHPAMLKARRGGLQLLLNNNNRVGGIPPLHSKIKWFLFGIGSIGLVYI